MILNSAADCAICGMPLSGLVKIRLGNARLVECKACGSWTYLPRPSLQDQVAIHDDADYFEHPYFQNRRNARAAIDRRCRQIFARISAGINLKSLQGERLLDVGCDTGTFLASAAYDISSELLNSQDISSLDLTTYFAQFDAIAEHDHMSNITLNERRASLSFWYLDGLLNLKGFYFAQSHPNLSYLLLNVRGANSVEGYGLRDGQLYHFEERIEGDRIFAAVLCPFDVLTDINALNADFFNSLFPAGETNHFPTENAIRTFIMPRNEYQIRRPDIVSKCKIREEIPGELQKINKNRLIERLNKEDRKIKFYQSFSETKASKIKQSAPEPTYVTEGHWDSWEKTLAKPKIKIDKATDSVKVITNLSTYDSQLMSPAIPVDRNTTYLIEFNLRILNGGSGIFLLGADRETVIASQYWCEPTVDFSHKKFIFDTGENSEVFIGVSNCGSPNTEVSRFSLKDLTVRQVQLVNSVQNS